MFNSEDIKRDFPIFEHYPNLVFADNASTTQKPNSVIEAISNFYSLSNANVHRSVYDLGVKSNELYEATREKLCNFYSKENAIFTSGTTDGINKLARSLEHQFSERSNIVVSEMEHHSNLVPWQELCRRTGATLRMIPMNRQGELDLSNIHQIIDKDTKVVSLVHISNAIGTVNDLSLVSKITNDLSCHFIVDAAQSCTLHQNEIQNQDADAIVFSAHKMFGPSGIGVILAKDSFLQQLKPFNYGGGMVTDVSLNCSSYVDHVARFEGGTPPLAQVAGISTTLDYLSKLDLERCKGHIRNLARQLRNSLNGKDVVIIGNPDAHSGIISFNFNAIHPHDAASFLNSKNIAVRAGHHCAQLTMKKFNAHASLRFSFSIYNHEDEIEKIDKAIYEMKKFFQ